MTDEVKDKPDDRTGKAAERWLAGRPLENEKAAISPR
jgi:hypothetical protein